MFASPADQGLGKYHKLLKRGPGQSPGRKCIFVNCQLRKRLWQLHFLPFQCRKEVQKLQPGKVVPVPGQNDTFAPLVLRVLWHFSRCPCGVGACASCHPTNGAKAPKDVMPLQLTKTAHESSKVLSQQITVTLNVTDVA